MPETIILNVEFFYFFGGDTPTPLPPAESDPPPRVDARFLVETVFSLTGLRDAVNTVLLQRSRYHATLTERGFSPLYNYLGEVEQAGHYILFRQRAEENVRRWLRRPQRILPLGGGISADQQDVEAVVDLATAAGSKVHLVIYPYHAQFRLMLERLGLGQLFADWKRMVVAIADRHGGGSGSVQVWDCSGIAPEMGEGIPPAGDRRTHLRYYWVGGHSNKALADRVIARILGEPVEFGQQIDSANIDNWLLEDRRQVLAFLATPEPLLTEVDDILAHAQKIGS